jgi:hypothetical protein
LFSIFEFYLGFFITKKKKNTDIYIVGYVFPTINEEEEEEEEEEGGGGGTAADLLLQSKDVTDTAIDGVSNPGEGLVAKSDDGIEALVWRNAREELGGIAGAEHLVHSSEVSSALLRVKIGRKYATAHALSP